MNLDSSKNVESRWTIGIRNPGPNYKESGPEFTAWNPESKTALDYLPLIAWGEEKENSDWNYSVTVVCLSM